MLSYDHQTPNNCYELTKNGRPEVRLKHLVVATTLYAIPDHDFPPPEKHPRKTASGYVEIHNLASLFLVSGKRRKMQDEKGCYAR